MVAQFTLMIDDCLLIQLVVIYRGPAGISEMKINDL